MLNAVPLLLRIPGLAGKVLRSQKAFLTQLDELLTEHRMTWDPAQPPRDLTEAFLAEMEKVRAAATVGIKGGGLSIPGGMRGGWAKGGARASRQAASGLIGTEWEVIRGLPQYVP